MTNSEKYNEECNQDCINCRHAIRTFSEEAKVIGCRLMKREVTQLDVFKALERVKKYSKESDDLQKQCEIAEENYLAAKDLYQGVVNVFLSGKKVDEKALVFTPVMYEGDGK